MGIRSKAGLRQIFLKSISNSCICAACFYSKKQSAAVRHRLYMLLPRCCNKARHLRSQRLYLPQSVGSVTFGSRYSAVITKEDVRQTQTSWQRTGETSNKESNVPVACKVTGAEREEGGGIWLRLVTWITWLTQRTGGMSVRRRGGKQSRGIRNYRDKQRHSRG